MHARSHVSIKRFVIDWPTAYAKFHRQFKTLLHCEHLLWILGYVITLL